MSESLHRLFLVRHGDTAWSDTHRHTGLADILLNANGEQQARALGTRLKASQFARIFTSPLERAIKTCELSGFAAAAEHDPDLVEWDYGDYEGRTTREIRDERKNWNLFCDGCPNGETSQDVMLRADRFIAKVRSVSGYDRIFKRAYQSRHCCTLAGARTGSRKIFCCIHGGHRNPRLCTR
jgi:broad specificity phosphatase PhoE